MPLSKEFYLDEIRSKYPNSYNESLKDLPVKDLEDMLDFLEGALEKADGGRIGFKDGTEYPDYSDNMFLKLVDKISPLFIDENEDYRVGLQKAKFALSKFIAGKGTDLDTGAEWYNKLDPETQNEIIEEKIKYRERGELGGVPLYDEEFAGRYGIGGNYADGGSIGIEVFFGPKREDFSIGGRAQRKVPYDPRASTLDYAAALDKVGAGTAEQKLKAFGDYAKNVASTGGKKVLQKLGDLTGYTQHNVNNQLLRNALEAGDITEKQYKLMGGYDVAQQFPGPQVTDDAMVGLSSLLYNAVKSGINIYDPQNPYAQYGQFSAPESIGLNMQGAKGLTATDKDIYERIISGKPVKSKTPLSESDFYSQFYGVPYKGFENKFFKTVQKGDPNYDAIRAASSAGSFSDLVDRGIIQAYTGPTDYKNYLSTFADGGRVGLFMGGPALEGQALQIYNSMNAYGFSDQEIADALSARGLYTPAGSGTGTETTAPNIIGSQINQGRDTGPTRPTSEIVTDFQETITNRQNKLNNPGKIASFVGDFIPQQRSVADMLASGQVDKRLTSGIPLGVGSMIAKALPDKYYDMSLADQITTQTYMGFTDPNTNMANKDPFGLNVRSAFGNYAEKAAEIVGTLEEKLARKGELSKYDQARLNHYRNVTKTKQDAVADIGLINLAKEQAEAKRQEALKKIQAQGKMDYNPNIHGPVNYGKDSQGNQSFDSGMGFGIGSDGGPVSNRTGRGRTGYSEGGLATMFKNKR